MKFDIGKFKHLRKKFFLGLVLAVLFVAVVFGSLFYKGYFKAKVLADDVVVERVMKLDEAKDYKGWSASALHVDSKQLQEKSKKYPLIYGDLTGDIYEIRLTQAEGEVLLLYDARSDKILAKFNLLDWKQ